MDVEVLAEGLAFPEGPVVLPDGSVILVEIAAGKLTRVHNGKIETIVELGGGPNGAALGPDGALYVCNNGGGGTPNWNGVLTDGRIERVDPNTGKFERIYEYTGEYKLSAPNDLVFDKTGGFWFTDLGKTHKRVKERSGIYYAKPDGSYIEEVSYGGTSYNGIGLSPDEKTVYSAESHTGRLMAFDLAAPGRAVKGGRGGRMVGAGPGRCFFDSLAIQANGDICIAAVANGIVTITPEGVSTKTPLPDKLVTNICFGGVDMRDAYITMAGSGKLVKVRWPEPGLKLNFNPYP